MFGLWWGKSAIVGFLSYGALDLRKKKMQAGGGIWFTGHSQFSVLDSSFLDEILEDFD